MSDFFIQNNDGKKEKLGDVKSGVRKEQLHKKHQNLFNAYDFNKDGVLEEGELNIINKCFVNFAGSDKVLNTKENKQVSSVFSKETGIENADFMGFMKSISSASEDIIDSKVTTSSDGGKVVVTRYKDGTKETIAYYPNSDYKYKHTEKHVNTTVTTYKLAGKDYSEAELDAKIKKNYQAYKKQQASPLFKDTVGFSIPMPYDVYKAKWKEEYNVVENTNRSKVDIDNLQLSELAKQDIAVRDFVISHFIETHKSTQENMDTMGILDDIGAAINAGAGKARTACKNVYNKYFGSGTEEDYTNFYQLAKNFKSSYNKAIVADSKLETMRNHPEMYFSTFEDEIKNYDIQKGTEFQQKVEQYQVAQVINQRVELLKNAKSEVEQWQKEKGSHTLGGEYIGLNPDQHIENAKQLLLQYFNGDEEAVNMALGGSVNGKDGNARCAKYIQGLLDDTLKMYDTVLEGKTFEEIKSEYNKQYKEIYGVDFVPDELNDKVMDAKATGGMVKIAAITAVSILITKSPIMVNAMGAAAGSEAATGASATLIRTLVSKYGQNAVQQGIKFAMASGTLTTDVGLTLINQVTDNRDGIQWAEVGESTANAAKYIYFGAYIGSPLVQTVANKISKIGLSGKLMADGVKTTSGAITTTTISGEKLVENFMKSSKSILAKSGALATEITAFSGLELATGDMSLETAFEEQSKMQLELKLMHNVFEYMLGGRAHTAMQKAKMETAIENSGVKNWTIKEIKTPNGTQYTAEIDGVPIGKFKDANMLASAMMGRISMSLGEIQKNSPKEETKIEINEPVTKALTAEDILEKIDIPAEIKSNIKASLPSIKDNIEAYPELFEKAVAVTVDRYPDSMVANYVRKIMLNENIINNVELITKIIDAKNSKGEYIFDNSDWTQQNIENYVESMQNYPELFEFALKTANNSSVFYWIEGSASRIEDKTQNLNEIAELTEVNGERRIYFDDLIKMIANTEDLMAHKETLKRLVNLKNEAGEFKLSGSKIANAMIINEKYNNLDETLKFIDRFKVTEDSMSQLAEALANHKEPSLKEFLLSPNYIAELKENSVGKYQQEMTDTYSKLYGKELIDLLNSGLTKDEFLSSVRKMSKSIFKFAYERPNQYLSGINQRYSTPINGKLPELPENELEIERMNIKSFFQLNSGKISKALKYLDIDTVSHMMDKRTAEFKKSLEKLSELSDNNLELLSQLTQLKSANTGIELSAKEKLHLIQIMEIFQSANIDTNILKKYLKEGKIDINEPKQIIQNEILKAAGIDVNDPNIQINKKKFNEEFSYLAITNTIEYQLAKPEVKENLEKMLQDAGRLKRDSKYAEREIEYIEKSLTNPLIANAMSPQMRQANEEYLAILKDRDNNSIKDIYDASKKTYIIGLSQFAINDEIFNVIKASVLHDFKDYIADPTNKYGKTNAQTKTAFEKNGLNYEKWLNPEIEDVELNVAGKQMRIKMWERNPQEDLFVGNKTTCCTAIGAGGGNGGATPIFLLNTSFNVVELHNANGETVGMSRVFMAKIDGKPTLVMDNIELNKTYVKGMTDEEKIEIRDGFFTYMNEYAQQVTGDKDTQVYFYSQDLRVPSKDLMHNHQVAEFIGNISQETVYFNSAHYEWIHPTNLSKKGKINWLVVPKNKIRETKNTAELGKIDENLSFEDKLEEFKKILNADERIDEEGQEEILDNLNEKNIELAKILCTDKDFPKIKIARILENTSTENIELAKILCADKDFPKEKIAGILHYTDKENIELSKLLCANKDFPKEEIAGILHYTDKENMELAKILCADKEFSKDEISDILIYTTKENIEFAKLLCANKEFTKDEISDILENTTKENIELAMFLCANKDFPKNKISWILGRTTKENIELVKILCANKDFPEGEIYWILHETNEENIELAKLLCADKDFPRGEISNILEKTTKENFEFAKLLCTDKDFMLDRSNIAVILSLYAGKNIETEKLIKAYSVVKEQRKLVENNPENYISGENTPKNVERMFTSLFVWHYTDLLTFSTMYDKEVLNTLLRKRTDDALEYLGKIKILNSSTRDLIESLSNSVNIDGKPFMPTQKIEFINLVTWYKMNKLSTAAMRDMAESGKVDLAQLHMDLFNNIMKNGGLTTEEIESIPKEKLVSWDVEYAHLLYEEVNEDESSAFNDILRAANLEPDFMQYLHNTENVYGKSNAQTKAQFSELSLNYDKWIRPSKENEVQFNVKSAAGNQLSQVAAQLKEDMDVLMQSPAKGVVKKQFPKFIKGDEFIIPNEYLSSKSKLQELVKILADTSEQGQLAKNIWNRAKTNAQNPDPTRAATARNTLTILDHLNQRIADIDKIQDTYVDANGKTQKIKLNSQLDWQIKMWDRVPQKDLFQGNYSTCCIGMGNGNGSAMPHYIMNTAYNMIEIVDNVSGKTVGNALCFFVKGEDGKPIFIIDNIEINNSAKPSEEVQKQLRDAITEYAANVSREVTGNENTPIYMGGQYNDVPIKDLATKQEKVSFVGDIDAEDIYMDLYGGWTEKQEFTSQVKLLKLK